MFKCHENVGKHLTTDQSPWLELMRFLNPVFLGHKKAIHPLAKADGFFRAK